MYDYFECDPFYIRKLKFYPTIVHFICFLNTLCDFIQGNRLVIPRGQTPLWVGKNLIAKLHPEREREKSLFVHWELEQGVGTDSIYED